MKRPSLTRTDAAGLAAAALVTAGAWFLGAEPVRANAAECAELQARIGHGQSQAIALARNAADARDRLAEKEREIADLPSRLMPVSQLTTKVGSLLESATARGPPIDTVQPTSPSDDGRLQRVPIQLRGRGGYAECSAFLHELHTRFRDVEVTALDVIGAADGSGNSAFTFQLVWYALPEGSK